MSRETMAFLVEQIDADREQWTADYEEGMARRDFEDRLRMGIGLFWRIQGGDEAWTRRIQNGEAEFDADLARGIHAEYEWWLQPCDSYLNRLGELERRPTKIDHAGQFRDCVQMARELVRIDVESAIQGMADVAAGRTVLLRPEDDDDDSLDSYFPQPATGDRPARHSRVSKEARSRS